MTIVNYYDKYKKYKIKYFNLKNNQLGGSNEPIIKNKVITIKKGTKLYRIRNLDNKEKQLNHGYNLFFVPDETKYNNNTLLENMFTLWQFRLFESNNDKNISNLIIDIYKVQNNLVLYYLDMDVDKSNNLLKFENKIKQDYDYDTNFIIDNNMLKGNNRITAKWIEENDNIDGWFCIDGKKLDEIMLANYSQDKIIKIKETILDKIMKKLFKKE